MSVDEPEAIARLGRGCPHCGATLHVFHRHPIRPNVCDVCGGRLGRPRADILDEIRAHSTVAKPLAAYYRGRWHDVDALGDHEAVLARMSATLTPRT